jgi:hypothetical protein
MIATVPVEREAYEGGVAIIGRGPELTAAASFLHGSGSGLRVLQFEGEAGIGKTTLWRETIGRASALGIRALPAPRAGALSRAHDLIDALERRGRELDRASALAAGARCRGLLLAVRISNDAGAPAGGDDRSNRCARCSS